eukprot:scaffold3028_cov174-Amphora_coffeaeformis.AAC.13
MLSAHKYKDSKDARQHKRMTNCSKSEQLEYEFVAGPVLVVAVQEMDREGREADKVMVGAGILGLHR